MKTTIISYSLSGNNKLLADQLATKLSCKHIYIKEKSKRSYLTIGMDFVFKRIPKIDFLEKEVNTEDFIIFIAPIWMSQVAFPLKKVFQKLKGKTKNYAFISACIGPQGKKSNRGLAKQLKKDLGKKPIIIIEKHLSEFLPIKSRHSIKETMKYKLKKRQAQQMAQQISRQLKQIV